LAGMKMRWIVLSSVIENNFNPKKFRNFRHQPPTYSRLGFASRNDIACKLFPLCIGDRVE
jgi:hypothetical protein